jgi:hypothetical protein
MHQTGMQRLGLICLCLLDGFLTLLAAASFIIMFLGFVNAQFDAGFIGLILMAVFGYSGWIVFNKILDRLPE